MFCVMFIGTRVGSAEDTISGKHALGCCLPYIYIEHKSHVGMWVFLKALVYYAMLPQSGRFI